MEAPTMTDKKTSTKSAQSERSAHVSVVPRTHHQGGPHGLTHVDRDGVARMVDVGEKAPTQRLAIAEGTVSLGARAAQAIREAKVAKGNVFDVARLAGIGGAKRTDELIPLCHSLPLDQVRVDLALEGEDVRITAEASAFARTGVEMEALVAVSVAALTVYDMLKAIDKSIVIGPIRLLEKSGGKSGPYRAATVPDARPGRVAARRQVGKKKR
jgi:cyclic pyranopterin phosphate synthase